MLDIFDFTDYFIIHMNRNYIEYNFLFKLKDHILDKKLEDKNKLSIYGWIILIEILYLECNVLSSSSIINSREYFDKLFSVNNNFLEDSLALLKALLSSTGIKFFNSYLIINVNLIKKYLKLKSEESKLESINFKTNLNWYISRLINKIKGSCYRFFDICYKCNKNEFFNKIFIISQMPSFFIDKCFNLTCIDYLIRFLRKWNKKFDINPKNCQFKNFNQYANFMYKLLKLYFSIKTHSLSKVIDNEDLINDIEIFKITENLVNNFNNFIDILETNDRNDFNIFKFILYYLNFFPSQFEINKFKFPLRFEYKLNRNKKLYLKCISNYSQYNDIREQFFELYRILLENKNFDPVKFVIKQLTKNKIIDKKNEILITLNLFRDNFIEYFSTNISNTNNFLDLIKKIIYQLEGGVQMNYIRMYKCLKKVFHLIITILIQNSDGSYTNHSSNFFVEFYIKNILNYKYFDKEKSFTNIQVAVPALAPLSTPLSTPLSAPLSFPSSINCDTQINYISFFRIKNNFIFAVFFERVFTFTAIEYSELNPLFNNLQNIYSGINLCKETFNKNEWWKHRTKLEKDLEEVLFNLQYTLVNTNNYLKENIKNIFLKNNKFINIFKYGSNETVCIDHIIDDLISYKGISNTKKSSVKFINDFYKKVGNYNASSSNCYGSGIVNDLYDENNLIYLIISGEMANFPIENIPIFYKLPIIRNLNYKLISTANINNEISENVLKEISLKISDTFFLLNPSQDLKNTQELLLPVLSQNLKFNGIIAREPNKNEIESRLMNCKLFIYCGHSNGCKYIDQDFIKYNKIPYITFLMGCSSVKIENISKLDDQPFDIASYYIINSCPALLGCLWDVTDVDIDRFTKCVLEKLFIDKSTDSLLEAILQAKHLCNFRYLNSSSIVLYAKTNYKLKLI